MGPPLHPQRVLRWLLGLDDVVARELDSIGESTALLQKLWQWYAANRAVTQSNQKGPAYTNRLARLTFNRKRLIGVQIEQSQCGGFVGK